MARLKIEKKEKQRAAVEVTEVEREIFRRALTEYARACREFLNTSRLTSSAKMEILNDISLCEGLAQRFVPPEVIEVDEEGSQDIVDDAVVSNVLRNI